MKILLTADPELPVPPTLYGGIERIVDLLVTELRSRGHTIGLVAHRDSTSPADQHFPWPGLKSQDQFDALQNTAALWSAVQKFKPDLLHSFSRVFYLLPLLNSSLPKVMSYQRATGGSSVKWATKIAKSSLTFTGCSEHICRQGRAGGGVWHPIHNCVEPEKFTFQPHVAEDAPLVFLSRIERIKGAHTAIKVAQKTGRRLLIAGNYSTIGEAGSYWENEILPHLGKNGIEYVGTVNDEQKNELLGQAAAMIVPIEWEEPFGIVFAESLACGTPVISCPRGALPEIVRLGVDGYLINTIEEACTAVENITKIDRSNCRQRVEEYFSTSAIVDQYEQLYCSLVGTSSEKMLVDC
ncbi:MAG: glycosyltransferase [Cyanobacteria bacterium J06592_8]